MNKLVLLLVGVAFVTSAETYSAYKNFRVSDSGEAIGVADPNIELGYKYFYFTNSYSVVTLNSNELFECKAFFASEQSYNNVTQSNFGGELNRVDSQLHDFVVIDQDEIWSQADAQAGATVIGPGTVYVRYTHRLYPYSNFSYYSDNIVKMDYSFRWNLRYQIASNKPESKFSVSLDNDGDRVAMGYKEAGSNAVIRVYEFDGSSWSQLGDTIE